MNDKSIQLINEETGEEVKRWRIEHTEPWEGMHLTANVPGPVIRKENIGMYTEKEPPEDPVLGNFIFQRDRGRYWTRIFQDEILEFSKANYYQYWHIIERRVEFNTNIIFYRGQQNKITRIETITQLARLLDKISYSTAKRFLNECLRQQYVGKIPTTNRKGWYAVNPRILHIGKYLPELVLELFN